MDNSSQNNREFIRLLFTGLFLLFGTYLVQQLGYKPQGKEIY
jgi:hypothetical protein